MNEMIYTYDGSFEGFLCCIFDSYANKEVLTAITDDEDSAPILFPVRAIRTDSGHAGRVLRKLHKLSPYGEELVRRGFLTCMEEREIRLYRLVVKLPTIQNRPRRNPGPAGFYKGRRQMP